MPRFGPMSMLMEGRARPEMACTPLAAPASVAAAGALHSDRLLARIIHEFPTASVESTASSGPSPSGLLDIVFNYACVALRSEGPESPALSTLSRRQPMNNPG
jgi:hypothetical protein